MAWAAVVVSMGTSNLAGGYPPLIQRCQKSRGCDNLQNREKKRRNNCQHWLEKSASEAVKQSRVAGRALLLPGPLRTVLARLRAHGSSTSPERCVVSGYEQSDELYASQ